MYGLPIAVEVPVGFDAWASISRSAPGLAKRPDSLMPVKESNSGQSSVGIAGIIKIWSEPLLALQ